MKRNHLGIDHPLIAVSDMEKAVTDFERLGFFINPRHHHPWGTDNHLLMFPENFIEVISIYDHSLLDVKNDNGFAFGRFISDSIERKEGISLVALHSKDARNDFKYIENEKIENQGLIDFRRIAHLPDGSEEEVVVSLIMLINKEHPSVSHFICHQHRPDLLWLQEWMTHPNGVNAITGVAYVVSDISQFKERYTKLYGSDAVSISNTILKVTTDRGAFEFMDIATVKKRYAGVEIPLMEHEMPSGIAIHLSTQSLQQTKNILHNNSVSFVEIDDKGIRIPSHYAGNTIFEIYEK